MTNDQDASSTSCDSNREQLTWLVAQLSDMAGEARQQACFHALESLENSDDPAQRDLAFRRAGACAAYLEVRDMVRELMHGHFYGRPVQ